MKMTIRRLFMLSTSVAVLAASTGAQAQMTDGAADSALPEIIVTATKRQTSLQDTPAQISAYSSEFIEQNAVREFSDLASSVPNLVAPDSLVGTTVVAIRGISSPAKGGSIAEQPVSAFLDGVFMPEGSLDDLIFDVQQIEVIRGPQGVIWGRNTLAGAISYTSRRPTEAMEGYVEAGFANYDHVQLRGAVSGPIVADTLLFRIAAAHQEQNGFSERVSGGTYGARNRESIRGSLLFRPSDPLEVTVIGDYSENDFTNVSFEYSTGPFAAMAGTDGDTRRQDTDFFEPSRQVSKGLNGLINYSLGDYTLASVTGYRKLDQTLNIDIDSSTLPLIHDHIENETEQFSQELRLTSPDTPDRGFDWMLGVYYYWRSQNVAQVERLGADLAGLPPGGEVLVDFTFDNGLESYAAFGTASYDLADRLTIGGGLRVTRDERSTNGLVTTTATIPGLGSIPLGTQIDDLDLEDTQVSPMATLSYMPADDVLLYASWGRGHKSGGFNDSRVSDPTFSPEKADSYEVGLKSEWLDKRLIFNLIGFYMDYRDLQVRGLEGTTPLFRNAEKATSKGFELEAVARPSANWSLSGNFAYNKAIYKHFVIEGAGPGGGDLDLSGNHMPLAPRTSFALATHHTLPVGDVGEAYLHGEWNYKSSYYLDFNNIRPGGRQSRYSVVNARIGFLFDTGIDVSLWGRNLTNADYKVDFIGELPPLFGSSQFHVLGAPRTYGVDVKFSF